MGEGGQMLKPFNYGWTEGMRNQMSGGTEQLLPEGRRNSTNHIYKLRVWSIIVREVLLGVEPLIQSANSSAKCD